MPIENLEQIFEGKMSRPNSIKHCSFYREIVLFFLRKVSSDLRPETGFDAWFNVKILTFQAKFLLLNPHFCPSHPFVLFLLPQIFLHFPADCGSCNADNKDKQGRSRGCITTSYPTALNYSTLTNFLEIIKW